MLIKTRAIVLRTVKYSETSLICDLYTEERGLQSYIFSGVRTASAKGNPSAAMLQILTLLDVVVYHKEMQTLHRCKEIRLAYAYQTLPYNAIKRSIGLFCLELTRKTIHEPEKNELLFTFLYDFFVFLDKTSDPVGNLPLYFLINLAGFLGFAPDGTPTEAEPYFDLQEGIYTQMPVSQDFMLNEDLSKILHHLYNVSIAQNAASTLKKSEKKLLLDKMLIYYKIHIDNFPEINSLDILRDIL